MNILKKPGRILLMIMIVLAVVCREIKKDEQLYVSIQIRECIFII